MSPSTTRTTRAVSVGPLGRNAESTCGDTPARRLAETPSAGLDRRPRRSRPGRASQPAQDGATSADENERDRQPAERAPRVNTSRAYHGRPVTTVLLVRHGLTALTSHDPRRLDAGRRRSTTPAGRRLAAVAERLRPVAARRRSSARRSSAAARPPQRDLQPAATRRRAFELDERLGDVRYGDWTGRTFKDLQREPRWKTIHARSRRRSGSPNGEALHEMGARAVAAVRDWNERLGAGRDLPLVSHADPIRAILADALGLGFDGFRPAESSARPRSASSTTARAAPRSSGSMTRAAIRATSFRRRRRCRTPRGQAGGDRGSGLPPG